MSMDYEKIASQILEFFPDSEVEGLGIDEDLQNYQDDPVGFIEKYFEVNLTDDVKKLCESVRDNEITIAKSATATGKTHSAALLAIWFYKVFPNSLVVTLAAPPESNLKQNLWSEIRSNIRANPKVFSRDKVTTLEITDRIFSKNDEAAPDEKKHSITGVTIPTSSDEADIEARTSGKHAPYLFFVVDEGDAVPDAIYRGISGCASGGHTRLLIMYNPKKKSGYAYRKTKGEDPGNVVELTAFNHPNVITGEDIIPGAVDRNTTVKRILSMTRPLGPGQEHDKNCFRVPDFLVGSTAKMSSGKYSSPLEGGYRYIEDQSFFYQCLGNYPQASDSQLISTEWIDTARTRWDLYVAKNGEKPPDGIRPILGMDVSDTSGDFNTICARYGGFVSRIRKWKGIDIQSSAEKAAEIHSDLHALITNVESDGLGSSVSGTMGRHHYYHCAKCKRSFLDNIENCPECSSALERHHVDAKKVKVGSKPTKKCTDLMAEFGLLRDELWFSLREWLRTDNTAMLPPSDTLREDLECVTYSVDKVLKVTPKKQMRKLLGGRSPDEADSLIQTFYSPKVPRIRMV